jgi:hypothetical protein
MTVLKDIIYTCGDWLWVRSNGEVIKRMFIEPYSGDYFVGQNRWGDNEFIHWNLIYGKAKEDDPWIMDRNGRE